MSLDGTIYLVRLLEIASHKISFDETGRIVWPKFIGEQELPVIDGALPKATIPFIVVACRCEGQIPSSRIDPATYDQARRVLGGIEVHHTYPEAPDSQKKCISNILRAIIARTAAGTLTTHTALPITTTDGCSCSTTFINSAVTPHLVQSNFLPTPHSSANSTAYSCEFRKPQIHLSQSTLR
ncbi:predicted protein [Histoplasma capsulatum H143]|uniref:Uncharacterized protein n=1 Tax=Ajellomyces capsulatus (strain H143) TaxID=544712 RepID=C6HAS8_AJECH|nr:predicted protein [Histoplasma capsulatum H143]